MSRIRSAGMKPEMAVRRLVYSMGYRYRLHRKELPGKPDLTFGPRRKVIFVHGCFWHQHADPECRIVRIPKSRPDYWLSKLARNKERDQAALAALRELDWKVFTVWECQIKSGDQSALADALSKFLDE